MTSDVDWLNRSLSDSERAAALLAVMSTEEKLSQLQCIFPRQCSSELDSSDLLARTPLGVGHVTTLEMRQLTSLDETAEFQRTVQRQVIDRQPHGVPAIFHMEALDGAYLPGAVSFPNAIGRGASFDPDLEEELGQIVSAQERAVGITYSMAPVLDIARDPRMGRFGEAYGEDPTLSGVMGAALTRGIQACDGSGRRSDAVAKHFLGFHGSEGGIHGTHASIGSRLLREVYAKPFQAAINSGLKGVMPCYNSVNGEVVSGSRRLLTGLLREEMGFEGTTVADYGAIGNMHLFQRTAETFADAGQQALEAGLDVEWHEIQGFDEELAERIRTGLVDMRVLDAAVLRVLTAKFRMGLFEDPYAWQGEQLREPFSGDADTRARKASLQSARESIVLLRNDGVLPLGSGASQSMARILVVGPQAVNARFFFAGYSHLSMAEGVLAARKSMAGTIDTGAQQATGYPTVPGTLIQSDETAEFDALLETFHAGTPTLVEELIRRLPDSEVRWARGYEIAGDSQSSWGEALEAARDSDLVICVLGGKNGTGSIASMGEGVDSTTVTLPPTQEGFLRELAALDIPAVGIHLDGRPVSSDQADQMSALVEAWNPAEAGAQAVVDVLVGEVNPSGRLPVSVARSAGQVPVYYNHPNGSQWHQGASVGFPEYVDMPHTPRYPFGHGLSYTTFAYSDLVPSAPQVEPGQIVTVSVTVMNTGDRVGTEVVQLYATDSYASMSRPVQELIGFQRVRLEPGEQAEVCFEVSPELMAFLDREMAWVVEGGALDLRVGSSSEDVRAATTLQVVGSAVVDPRRRPLHASAQVRQVRGEDGRA
ncbi:glycoside hydrolase family 3 N-terminal domain-containing protein [Actinomyces faecalis]|uniref:glycoside hydrolase family 3 N-terminal domain-containing protein n=1 Tax=Actinomyces faecalis TaxID=2722820 RepID=UPI001554749E|nr:glycoside hydrolase family 3 N-terminal domain-containing protein [Actinomyces faecalis]